MAETIFGALTKARDLFRSYESEHKGKAVSADASAVAYHADGAKTFAENAEALATSARDKAKRNGDAADMLDIALADALTPAPTDADRELADRIIGYVEGALAADGNNLKRPMEVDPNGSRLVSMLAEHRARNNITDPILRAQAEAAGAQMLDMQRECIALRRCVQQVLHAGPANEDGSITLTLKPHDVFAMHDAVAQTSSQHGIAEIVHDVTEFHEAFAPDWLSGGAIQPLNMMEAQTRGEWIRSEAIELEVDTTSAGAQFALSEADRIDLMAKQIDAAMDVIYFAAGVPMRMGLDPAPIWQIVHGANMAKRHPDPDNPGQFIVVRRESDGKVVKPEGWTDPHTLIVAEIERQIAERGQ